MAGKKLARVWRKMNQEITTKAFILSQTIILGFGLALTFGLYYFINSNSPKTDWMRGQPVTRLPQSYNLELTNPDDNLLTFDKSLIISGKAAPKSTIVISADVDFVTLANREGGFSKVITLSPGINNLTIVSFDETGLMKSAKRQVYYSEEAI